MKKLLKTFVILSLFVVLLSACTKSSEHQKTDQPTSSATSSITMNEESKSEVWEKADEITEKIEEKDKEDPFLTPLPTATSAPVITDTMSEYTYAGTGETIFFGSYEQDNNISNGKEPIEWIVLSNNGTEMYVISKYALDCKPYYNNDYYAIVAWELSSLRTWLNDEFYNTAFTSDEKRKIKKDIIVNDDNPEYGTSGGNDTKDKIFLPSISDMVNANYGFYSDYFDWNNIDKMINRRCAPTAYAKAQGVGVSRDNYLTAEGELSCGWWLCSVGCTLKDAAFLDDAGNVCTAGAHCQGGRGGVRPALIIYV